MTCMSISLVFSFVDLTLTEWKTFSTISLGIEHEDHTYHITSIRRIAYEVTRKEIDSLTFYVEDSEFESP